MAKPMPKTCSVDGCERQHQARGYCTIHYSQWQRSQPGYNEKRRLKRQDRKVPINCELCGKTKLVTVQHANVQRFCSLACAAMNKNKRRALKRQAFVANVYRKKIFERDRYRCQLKLPGCQGIDKNKVVPHPKAPTEDHIIPLNKGGTHEPANVHTACFYCNCHKSDGGGGEQLALIG